MRGALLVLVVLALATVLGLAWRGRNGRFRPTGAPRAGAAPVPGPRSAAASVDTGRDVVTARDLGVALGERATFVQLSSEVCAACRATSTVLAGVAADEPGVVHVELDVAEHLELVRRFGVMRTPTTLVVGHDGALVGRMSGATDRRQALAALASCGTPETCPGIPAV
ncbi:thioredoxin family protein [Cellulomonas dongxiuzhuiae]|uniref:Thioredoxin family protein n=1 Tax=Cellulomonas dongxiuzhuiae TaxID=2819979 RepID=A0ABX8GII4_9CELL|nr:thioredoxin family protein [Cellulomonas dongxiuzhuiae]MBO3094707.1 thioredoxin family protein [Cellulomonas dongxiuzhuiae]QWC15710.1 thioredoxin family protein [Cellulomonas dongxiuzhuiae]